MENPGWKLTNGKRTVTVEKKCLMMRNTFCVYV